MLKFRTAALTCFAYANAQAATLWIAATEFELTKNQCGLAFVLGWIGGAAFSIFYLGRHASSKATQC